MENTIIELIIQEIKHNQLVNGLYEIGLNDDDKYWINRKTWGGIYKYSKFVNK